MPTFTLTKNATNNTWQWLNSLGSAVSSGAADGSGQAQFACTGTAKSFTVSASGGTVSGTASPYTVTINSGVSSAAVSGTVTDAEGVVRFTLQKSTGGY